MYHQQQGKGGGKGGRRLSLLVKIDDQDATLALHDADKITRSERKEHEIDRLGRKAALKQLTAV